MIKSIRILGHDYSLNFVKGLISKESALGRCCCNTLEIEIDSDMCEQNISSTLIHEILEAINYRLELDLEHNQIMQLGTVLYQVLADNPKLKELI